MLITIYQNKGRSKKKFTFQIFEVYTILKNTILSS